MGRRCKNPPVVEALCEFQFASDQRWDMTIPGLMYERLKGGFPDKQEEISISFQLRPTEKGVERKIEIEPIPPKIQFFKKDKTALVQIAPDLLVVNCLKPYPSWERFKALIAKNLEIYREIANPIKVSYENLENLSVYLQIQEAISELESLCIFKNPEKIRDFLMSNAVLIGVLRTALGYISRIFGEVKVSLELHQDPEGDFEGLFVIIKTDRSPEEAIELLNQFDEEWWLNVDDEISNILGVMVRPG